MRVPEAAANGVAKVTVSFDAWKEGQVEPATFEMPVVELEARREVHILGSPTV